jgi:type IV secretion system protein TrbL
MPPLDTTCKVNPNLGKSFQSLGAIGNAIGEPFRDTDARTLQAGQSIAGGLIGSAKILAGGLALLSFLWGLALYFTKIKGTVFEVLFNAILPASLVAVLLSNYDKFVSFVGWVAGLFNVGDPYASFASLIGKVFAAIGMGAYRTLEGFSCATQGFWPSLGAILDGFIGLLIYLICIVVALLAAAEFAFVLVLGSMMVGLAVAVGPLFMASAVTPVSKGFFDKWLGFIFAAFLIKVVAGLVVKIMDGVMSNVLSAIVNPGTSVAVSALASVIMLWVLKQLVGQVPSIASALVPGTLGGVSAGSNGLGSLIGGLAGGAAGAAAGGVMGGARTAAAAGDFANEKGWGKAARIASMIAGGAAGAAQGAVGGAVHGSGNGKKLESVKQAAAKVAGQGKYGGEGSGSGGDDKGGKANSKSNPPKDKDKDDDNGKDDQ